MENEERNIPGLPKEPDRQIQLVVNRSEDSETTVDLGNVFRNMKLRARVFAWVLVLCLVVGICAPLLLYQFSKPFLTVSSVVTLRYEAPVKVRKANKNGEMEWVIPEDPEYVPVEDLSATDGEELDLNQITSAYVLQTALDGMALSQPVTAANLRANLSIRTVLTDESSRAREALQGLADVKNAEAYTRLQGTEMKYKNQFVVSLTNGFGEEDSRVKLELKDEELRMLLDRVLTIYNDYLVKTYADLKLPEDRFSAIDVAELDVLDSLDELRAGIEDLQGYISGQSETVQAYRSWKTGRTLNDWTESLKTFRELSVDYLYAYASEKSITRSKQALLASYKYTLRNTQNDLQKVNEDIEETAGILKNYKNDEIYISMQESDGSRTTRAATEYYNELVLRQADNYDRAQKLQDKAADYQDRIPRLEAAVGTGVTEDIEAELARSLSSAQALYGEIRDHMEELFESPLYTTYEEHSMPQGKLDSFLTANVKKIIIGAAVGAVLACCLWFLAGLVPEFSKNRKAENAGKEAEDK